ncbi:hypothetical protein KAR91_83640 [Candidatus Pacearchaeota archaeon]|nr:hypothetical protein [Candidatus Pacearchaeota archaeon]
MGGTATLLDPEIIAKEALMMLKNSMVMGSLVHRKYKEEFVKVGGSISIRKPVKFTVTKSRVRTSTANLTEKSITLTVATQAHVAWSFHTVDLTLTIQEYSERYIKPAANVLANQVDLDLCALYENIPAVVAETTSWSSDPASFLVLGKAAQMLDEAAVPQDERCVVLNPAGHWSLANALRTIYVTDVAKPIVTKGFLARIANFNVYMDQNIYSHTTANRGTGSRTDDTGVEVATGAPASSAVYTSGISLCDFDIVTTNVLKTGDVFTIAGVFGVNPVSGLSTGQLRQFVVTATASCGSTGTTTEVAISVSIQPGLADSGPYRTVSTMPGGGAAVDILGHVIGEYAQNLAFHKNAFALVMVPMEMPHGAWGARATEESTGISIRVVKAYDIDTDEEVCRLDILYGVKTLYPELACRIWGKQAVDTA